MKKVTVFLSSKEMIPEFRQEAYELGRRIALSNMRLVYGGARVGLMGYLADGAAEYGGTITGITTYGLALTEGVHGFLREDVRVNTLDQRRRLLIDAADAIVILPGGMGTLDEMFQVLTEIQLDHRSKPVILVNLHGYFDGLLDFFKTAVYHSALQVAHVPKVVRTVEEAMKELTA
jgi:uncharacterized protein (TIGR00730 family)